MPNKLKIGLLLDSFDIPFWAYSMLERIQHSNYAEITLVVMNGASAASTRESPVKRLIKNRHKIFYRAYVGFEHFLFKYSPDAFEVKDASGLLSNARRIDVAPRQTQHSDYIEGEGLEAIRGHGADVIIRLGFRILRGDILRAARFGVWSYHHGDNATNRGGPPGFWELQENRPVVGSLLQILTEDLDNGLVMSRSFSATHQLLSRTLNHCYWKSVSLLPRKLEELHKIGEERFFAKLHEENKQPSLYSNRLYTTPKNWEVMQFFFVQLAKYAKLRLSRLLFLERWILLFKFDDRLATSFHNFQSIVPAKGQFWADPFAVCRNGIYYIFMEAFDYRRKEGHISVVTADEKRVVGEAKTVLDKPYHLSYPFVFEWEGEYYMMPESIENHTIELYKCVEFPHKWVFHKNVMENIDAVDATLFQHDGKWWLFANIKEYPGASDVDELFLFYADNPMSDHWTAHPSNPIVSDVRRARPAGKIFVHNGSIYRPSQDCSVTYGHKLNLNEIVTLNEAIYEERKVACAEARWDKIVKRVHTINHELNLTLIDALIQQPKRLWYALVYGVPSFFVMRGIGPDILVMWRRMIRIALASLVLQFVS